MWALGEPQQPLEDKKKKHVLESPCECQEAAGKDEEEGSVAQALGDTLEGLCGEEQDCSWRTKPNVCKG